jgi:hypothetical protein
MTPQAPAVVRKDTDGLFDLTKEFSGDDQNKPKDSCHYTVYTHRV